MEDIMIYMITNALGRPASKAQADSINRTYDHHEPGG